MDKTNFIEECAQLLQAMIARGYKRQTLHRKLKRQITAFPGIYDSSPSALLSAIDARLTELLGTPF